jgi:predicted RecB family nuclease
MKITTKKKRLSKSDYLAGLQCSKHLWLRINEPGAAELQVDAGLSHLFEQGRKVGELARTYVPGGTLIDLPYYAIEDRVRATKRAIDNDGVEIIYEASFATNKLFVAIDILESSNDGFVVTEVKSSTSVKDEHLQELVLQAYVIRQCGYQVSKLQLMHINRQCAYPDLENLFITEDVTKDVTPLLKNVEKQIKSQAKVLSGSLPVIQIGPHCSTPYECEFTSRCWADVPPHHVTTIYRLGSAKAFELVEQGFETINDLPDDFRLNAVAARQRRAVVNNKLIVEPTLLDALKEFPSSIGFLDFETVALAIPVWDGCHPYDAVPVQFSFTSRDSKGAFQHSEWLADGSEDPREAIAEALVDACQDVKRIAAYNASFERKCIRHLSDAVPGLSADLDQIEERLVDLLPVVRNHVYHPEFYGSFGLKSVFPVITGDDVYDTLEIADGALASWLLQSLLLEPHRFTSEERRERREELLAYCRADTEGLAKLFYRLREF